MPITQTHFEVLGACPHDCPDTCSLITTVEDGKAVQVRGNPGHRHTAGVLCAKVARYPERTHHAERLLHPSLVASPGSRNRRFGQEQAFVAWLYFMIFALSLTAVMLALSLLGVGFESGLLLATASLTTTGQLASVGGDHSVAWGSLAAGPQVVLCLAMVLGRVETLAFVALLNPAFWRR